MARNHWQPIIAGGERRQPPSWLALSSASSQGPVQATPALAAPCSRLAHFKPGTPTPRAPGRAPGRCHCWGEWWGLDSIACLSCLPGFLLHLTAEGAAAVSFELMEPRWKVEDRSKHPTHPFCHSRFSCPTPGGDHDCIDLPCSFLFFISFFGKYLICSITRLGGCTCTSLLASLFVVCVLVVCFVFFAFFALTVWALQSGQVGRRIDLDAVSIRQVPCWADAVPDVVEPGSPNSHQRGIEVAGVPVSPLICYPQTDVCWMSLCEM
ncbi:hypothetical protein F5144DRAFT_382839 [Chaetomium tenue]|uniref:Uncharacterized protein n=1 Tax=Chaetomium tenue TaxID=1854479 RepID=A0ACB7NWM8_9PEZI|nr:hypothetical protein F5144DRAFT_382839 [Chaetomium globosum]